MLELFQAQKMLTEISPAFLAHYYGEGTDGSTFANWIITQGLGANPTQEGRQVYDGLKEAGKDKIMFLLRSHDIWQRIGSTPQKTNAFIDSFLAYDAIMEQQEREEESPAA